MKYIKTYENYEDESDNDKNVYDLLDSVCHYFDSITPISEEDGFLKCLFDDPEIYGKDTYSITFYFLITTTEDTIEKFYNFLEENEIKTGKSRYNKRYDFEDRTRVDEYDIILSLDELKKYAELYNATNKYNL